MFGYHTNILNKSFKKSIENAYKISNINAFQIFISSPLQLKLPKHDEEDIIECKEYVNKNNFFLVSHATYLLNTGTKDKFKYKVEVALGDLLCAEKIGAVGSIFHTGKHLKLPIDECVQNMFEFISVVIEELKKINSKSIFILETSSASGTELLSNMEDFGEFYHKFSKKQQENLKVCIDTCHVFSAGYSLKSKSDVQKYIKTVDKYIGWNNVLLIHLNDSKKDCGCHVDRHENLCIGCIGKDDETGFQHFVKYCVSKNIPLILETPDDEDKYHSKELEQIKKWLNI